VCLEQSCNYVGSLHFADVKGRPFHPAVASVQTQSREVFILRDTGQEIGTEEAGVQPVWMELLDCDAVGCPRNAL